MIPIAISLHLLAAVIWVGGMFFAYLILRPIAASQFDPPARLTLWSNVFAKFFPWVWACVVLLFGTGFWLIESLFGGMSLVATHIHIMLALGLIMTLVFSYLFFIPYRRFKFAVSQQIWPDAGNALAQIRKLIAVNLALGLSVTLIASTGRYLFS